MFRSILASLLSYTILLNFVFIDSAHARPGEFADYQRKKDSYTSRLKKAKTVDEFISIQNEAFKGHSSILTSMLAKLDDKKLEVVWENVNSKFGFEQMFKVEGNSAREKLNYLNSDEFQVQVANYLKKEIKDAGGYERFQSEIARGNGDCFSAKDEKCKAVALDKDKKTGRSVAQSTGTYVGLAIVHFATLILCIALLPICLIVAIIVSVKAINEH